MISLAGQEEVSFDFAVSVATDSEGAAALVSEVEALQQGHGLKLHQQPHPEWSA